MLQITQRDKIFVLIVLPLVLVGCYWHFIRQKMADEVRTLESEMMSRDNVDNLLARQHALERRRAEIADNLKSLAAASPTAKFEWRSFESTPEVIDAVFIEFKNGGARILASRESDVNSEFIVKLLDAENASQLTVNHRLPGVERSIVKRRFDIEAPYGKFYKVLASLSSGGFPMIVESVSLRQSGTSCFWTVDVWL